jgi:hypothetical protein
MTTHNTTTQAGGDRLSPLLGHPAYWRATAEQFRAEGWHGLAASYDALALKAESYLRTAEQAAGRAGA